MSKEAIEKVSRRAKESGQSEAKLLAGFVRDVLEDEKYLKHLDLCNLVVSCMDEVVEWATAFKEAAKEGW